MGVPKEESGTVPFEGRFAVTKLWLMWTIFTAAALVVGYWIGSALEAISYLWSIRLTRDPYLLNILAGLSSGLGYSLALAIGQGLVLYFLRGRREALKWGALTTIGFMAGELFQYALFIYSGLNQVLILQALSGLILGALQWLYFRREAKYHWAWIPASIVGWGIGGYVSLRMGTFFGLIVGGSLLGAITGVVLVWLLVGLEPRKKEKTKVPDEMSINR